MTNRPGFCATCKASLDPEDDGSRECADCTDDIIDNDAPPDDTLPGFDWRNSEWVKAAQPDFFLTPMPSSLRHDNSNAPRMLTPLEIAWLKQEHERTIQAARQLRSSPPAL